MTLAEATPGAHASNPAARPARIARAHTPAHLLPPPVADLPGERQRDQAEGDDAESARLRYRRGDDVASQQLAAIVDAEHAEVEQREAAVGVDEAADVIGTGSQVDVLRETDD